MADNTGSGMTPLLALLLGGVIVAVIVLGIFVYNGAGGSAAPATKTVVVEANHAVHRDWLPRNTDEHRDQGDAHHDQQRPH